MKKGLILGAAALAALSFAPGMSEAGDSVYTDAKAKSKVKFGGYYRVQGVGGDINPGENDNNAGNESHMYYRHRLHINMDMEASEKTAAHLQFRPVNDNWVQGGEHSLDSQGNVSSGNHTHSETGGTTGSSDGGWDIQRLWMETEAAGITIKFGNMPLNLNDGQLYNDDGGSVGGLWISKKLGNVEIFAMDMHQQEGNTTSSVDDADIYALGVMGKAGNIDYNATLAYLDAEVASNTVPTVTTGSSDGGTENVWLAVTVGAKLGAMDLKVTGMYESGYDNYDKVATKTVWTEQAEGSGYYLSAKLSGKTGFGSWKTFGWYADEDFNALINKPNWNYLHDSNSPGDMMEIIASNTAGSINADEQENTYGIGGQLTMKAGKFSITPGLEYIALTEDSITAPGATTATKADIDSAWGAYLILATQIDNGTTLSLSRDRKSVV